MNPENKTLSLLPSGESCLRIKTTQRETGAEMAREHHTYTTVNLGPCIMFPNKIFHFSLSSPVLSLQKAPSCFSVTAATMILQMESAAHLRKQDQGRGVTWVAWCQACGWSSMQWEHPRALCAQHLQLWKEAVTQPCTLETATWDESLAQTYRCPAMSLSIRNLICTVAILCEKQKRTNRQAHSKQLV